MTAQSRFLPIIAFAALLLPSSSEAQDRESALLTVRVVDGVTGEPLEGALIVLAGLFEHFETGEGGETSFMAPVGNYVLTAYKRWYTTLEGDFEVRRSGSFTLRLFPSEDAGSPAVGRLLGTILDSEAGRPLAGAAVAITGLGQALTDEDGRFQFAQLPPGPIDIRVRTLGYATRTDVLEVRPGRTTVVEVRMAVDPIELAPITVEVRSQFLESRGVYRRIEGGRSGQIVTRADIEARDSYRLSDSLRGVPGLRIERQNKRTILLGRGRCQLRVYVDGVRARPGIDGFVDIDLYPPEWVEAAEVYPGLSSVPIEFYETGEDCGVVLLWSRVRAR